MSKTGHIIFKKGYIILKTGPIIYKIGHYSLNRNINRIKKTYYFGNGTYYLKNISFHKQEYELIKNGSLINKEDIHNNNNNNR